MGTVDMWRPWEEILSGTWEGVDQEYGPYSHAAVSALEIFAQGAWLDRVGSPAPLGAPPHVAVSSWAEAVEGIWGAPEGTYDRYGHLAAPAEVVKRVVTDGDNVTKWLECVLGDYENRIALSAVRRDIRDEKIADFVEDYLTRFLALAAGEIIAGTTNCVYFREMLAWFAAGRCPIGWEGAWPVGRIRVY